MDIIVILVVDSKTTPCLLLSVDEPHIKLDPVTTVDVKSAIAHTKPSARLLTEKYKKWQQEYESV